MSAGLLEELIETPLGSIGITPKKGIEECSARDFPPPLDQTFVHS